MLQKDNYDMVRHTVDPSHRVDACTQVISSLRVGRNVNVYDLLENIQKMAPGTPILILATTEVPGRSKICAVFLSCLLRPSCSKWTLALTKLVRSN